MLPEAANVEPITRVPGPASKTPGRVHFAALVKRRKSQRNAPTPSCCQATLSHSGASHSCASLIVARVSVETALFSWVLGAPDGIADDQLNQRVVSARSQRSNRTQEFSLSEFERLRARIQPTRQALLDHRIYRQIRGLDGLRLFTEHHVFAVWDFMSLLKALQQRICCVDVPWIPSRSSSCRLINEIVLGEESDEDGEGGSASHFELYHRAMQQCGASTTTADEFLNAIRQGQSISAALQTANVGQPVSRFVCKTFEVIESNDTSAIASAFTFGREDLLPGVFRRIVEELNAETHGRLDRFRYYLDRHIQLDDDKHGPMAERLVANLCGSDDAKWEAAEEAARCALQARLDLWDSVSGLLA
jgi:hypothetical protein